MRWQQLQPSVESSAVSARTWVVSAAAGIWWYSLVSIGYMAYTMHAVVINCTFAALGGATTALSQTGGFVIFIMAQGVAVVCLYLDMLLSSTLSCI